MATLKISDINKALLKKGFFSQESDHTFFYLFVNGQKTSIWTKYSHGEKEIGNPLIAQMASQTKLEKDQFMDLIRCPLSKEKYIDILKNNGHIK